MIRRTFGPGMSWKGYPLFPYIAPWCPLPLFLPPILSMDHCLLGPPHLPRNFHGHETRTPLPAPTDPSQAIYRLYSLLLLSPSQLRQIETPLSPSQNPHQSHRPPNISSPPLSPSLH